MNYTLKHKDGSKSEWFVSTTTYDNISLQVRHFDKEGWYVAAKSKDYVVNQRDLESNLLLAKSFGIKVVKN